MDETVESVDARTILDEDTFSIVEAGEVLGATSDVDAVNLVSQLFSDGVLVGLPRGRGGRVFPVFQFDVVNRCVFPVVAEVNKRLNARDEAWKAAAWWVKPCPIIGGDAPIDVVGEPGDRVLLTVLYP